MLHLFRSYPIRRAVLGLHLNLRLKMHQKQPKALIINTLSLVSFSVAHAIMCDRKRCRAGNPRAATVLGFFVYENPALGAGGSEALLAMGQDKKTPFDVE